jgi:preprotein translocase subunit Sec61beta
MESPDPMAKKQDSGFHSAAGLIRYFDQEDEKALKVPPWIVVALCVALSFVILYVTYSWPL